MGQPVTQIVLDVVCENAEKGRIVLMVNNFSSEYLYERDDVFVGDHRRGDAHLRLRSGPSPYLSVFTFALCRCTLVKDLFCDI
jgi:hypothetical protein